MISKKKIKIFTKLVLWGYFPYYVLTSFSFVNTSSGFC